MVYLVDKYIIQEMKTMIKKIINDNEMMNSNTFSINELKTKLPQYFDKDGNFMMEQFKEMLKQNDVNLNKEGYSLKFLGKSYAKYLASIDTTTAIVPNKEHNSQEENKNSDNLYIIGDNLDALHHLVKSYAGKIKCIYIDPPYNTGSDGFVYNDSFNFTVENLMKKIGIEEDEAKRIIDLQGKSSHSAWLTFIYPRLVLAKELLSDDGVIFISIDDNEQANLKLILDEVFGEQNFVGNIHWESKTKSQNTITSYNKLQPKCETIFLYKKNNKDRFNLIVKGEKEYPFTDEKGEYREYILEVMNAEGIRGRKTMVFDISDGVSTVSLPEGKQWQLGQDQVATLLDSGDLFIRNNQVIVKMRPDRERNEVTEPFWAFFDKKIGTAESAKKDLKKLFRNEVFETVKPVELIKRLIYHTTEKNNNDIILDFFSGSATTAHAIMQLNAKDGGNRKYILVQLPEEIDKSKPAYKAGYRTIDEIGRERIVRAAKMIKEETRADIDYGFKLIRLEEPAIKTLDSLLEFSSDENMFVFDDYVEKFGIGGVSGEEVILATWLNQDGYGLNPKVNKIKLNSYELTLSDRSVYIIKSGLETEDVKELVRMIECDELDITRVVVYPYSLSFSVAHELSKNLKVLKASKTIDVIERY